MKSLFNRMHTDKSLEAVTLEDSVASAFKSSCWLVGGGPSLTPEIAQQISMSPAPVMTINLAGHGLLRPNYWTSYDPTERFLKSIYLDPGIIKFVHQRRGMDLVPGTTYKVCESPQLYVFDRDTNRGYTNMLGRHYSGIIDWQDSMVQGIDILYRLGFRRIFLAGCEMRIKPDESLIEFASSQGINWNEQGLLRDFIKSCEKAGISQYELSRNGEIQQYHFDEEKSLSAAANTDFHYFRVAQYLRLSRKSISLAGLDLISTTPHSRLNDYFPYLNTVDACKMIKQDVGDPQMESTKGLYTGKKRELNQTNSIMQDFPPHQFKPAPPKQNQQITEQPVIIPREQSMTKIKHSQFGLWCQSKLQEMNSQ